MTVNAPMARRLAWVELPAALRARVEAVLGSRVVTAQSQPGGFSPGSADRLTTETGARGFVKAASLATNPDAPGLHLREAKITALLPPTAHGPQLLGVVEWENWVAVVLADVDGCRPSLPWTDDALTRVFDALHDVASAPVASDLRALLPSLRNETRALFGGWHELNADLLPWEGVSPDIVAWARPRVARFAQLADEAIGFVDGNSLLHLDVRADNILIGGDGTVTLVDWPWACIGASWFDGLALLINVQLADPTANPDVWIERHAVFNGMDQAAVDRVIAGFAGFFLNAGLQPAPPGLPTLRSFQLAQAVACLSWLQRRRG